MTDRELQDLLDRIAREEDAEASIPDEVSASKDFRAYQLLYEALEDEPDVDLSPDFAERVADRVMPAPEAAEATERFPWLEWVLPPVALVAAFILTLIALPTVLQSGATALELVLDPLRTAWTTFRLDLVLTVGVILLLVNGIDRFIVHPRIRQHLPSAP